MSSFSHIALQQAMYARLTDPDEGILDVVQGIYDRPPQGSPLPYVTIGEIAGSNWSSATTTGMQCQVTLYIWSREGGRKECAVIMERIHALLHQTPGSPAPLTISGHTLVMMYFDASAIGLEKDGFTYKGTLQFKAWLQAN